MKKIIIPVLTIILIIALVAVGVLSYKLIKANELYNDNKALHCAAKYTDRDGKYDLYFHFKDSILNKYTLVYTKEEPITETAYENFKKTYLETNSTSLLMTNKIMQFPEKTVITENSNLEGLTYEQLVNDSFVFLNKTGIMSRKEIIDFFENKINEAKEAFEKYGPEEAPVNFEVKCE